MAMWYRYLGTSQLCVHLQVISRLRAPRSEHESNATYFLHAKLACGYQCCCALLHPVFEPMLLHPVYKPMVVAIVHTHPIGSYDSVSNAWCTLSDAQVDPDGAICLPRSWLSPLGTNHRSIGPAHERCACSSSCSQHGNSKHPSSSEEGLRGACCH